MNFKYKQHFNTRAIILLVVYIVNGLTYSEYYCICMEIISSGDRSVLQSIKQQTTPRRFPSIRTWNYDIRQNFFRD